VVGLPCSICKTPSEGGYSFFDASIVAIASLLQEAFLSLGSPTKNNLSFPGEGERAHAASVLIFFCIIKELLLERFLYNRMEAMELPSGVIKQLSNDNDTHSLRLKKLFPALIDCDWTEALKVIDPEDKKAYPDLNNRLKEITGHRNNFIHEGKDWVMDKSVAEQCLVDLFPLLELFVELNNKYVHTLYFAK
jgi:hypothetical protein